MSHPLPLLSRPLVLASASPRRAELLMQIGLYYRLHPAHVRETPPRAGEELRAWAQGTALEKARTAAAALPAEPLLLLGADTVVVLPAAEELAAPLLDGAPVRVLGKPHHPAEAVEMLHALSGRPHTVISAFALLAHPEGTATTDVVATTVYCAPAQRRRNRRLRGHRRAA